MSDFFSPAKIIDQQNVEALNAPNVMPWQKQNQPEQAPSVQAQKFQPSNPDSAPSDPEQEESGGFWSDWDKRSEEVTTEQTANQSRYGVDLNPDEYEILNKYISGTTDDPAEMEQNSYRMATALKYSNMFGISLEDAAQNLDKYNLALFGPDAESRDGKSLYHAVVDSFEMGNNTMKQGAIGLQMRNAELRGETALADSLRKEYELIENDSAELSKDVPRKWYAEALKYGAQSAPFTLSAVVAGLIPGIGPAAAFGVSYYQTEGLEYMEMRKDGATPETASCVGALSGGLQAVVEVALGDTMAATGGILKAAGKQVLGEQARSVLIDKITESVFKRMHYSGAFKAVAKGLMRYAGENVEEGLEEVVQEAISLTGKSVAAAMDDYQIEHKSAADIAQDLGENFKGGFLGSLVLGLPVTALNTTAALKDYADVKKKAETVQSEQAFKADMEKSPVFAGMDDKTKAGLVDEVWRNAQPARDREAAETLSDVKESADVGSGVEESEEDENGERVQRPAEYRDEGGRIHTEFDSQAASENDGAVKGRLLAGDPTRAHSLDDGGNRYGYIDYEENDGKVEITAFKMAPGREDIAPEFYREFAERFAGEDISWTPQQATNVALKKRIMEENPNGVKAGLNYYADEESVADVRARMQIADSLAKSSPKLNAETRAGVVALFEARASKLGMSLSDMVSDHYSQGIFTNEIKDQGISEGIAQTEAAGKGSVLGGTVFSKDGKLLDATQMVRDAKALIYVSKNSDFNTAAHEFAHTVLHYMTEGEMQAAEDAFKVEDHQWTVDKQEAFADGFVDYLRTGKAPSAGLKELFSKCATWLAGVFRGLQGKIDMNPELQKMYASLLADDGTGLAQAERAVKEQGRMSAARRQYESETDDVNNKSEKEETNGLDTESSVQAEQEEISPAEQKSPDDAASKIIEDPAQPVEAKVQAATDSAGSKYFQALNKDAPASRWTTGPNGENLLDGQEAMLFQTDEYDPRQFIPKERDERNYFDTILFQKSPPPDSPQFKKWFGKSKAVGKDGSPEIFYHGSGAVFTEFNTDYTGSGNDQYGSGFYFTDSKDVAASYSAKGTSTRNVIDAYLSLQKPVVLDGERSENLSDVKLTEEQVYKILRESPSVMDVENSPLGDMFDRYWETGPDDGMLQEAAALESSGGGWNMLSLENTFFTDRPTEFRQAINKVTGYDGVIINFKNVRNAVAWFPGQIKSASRNNGNFDMANPSILFQTEKSMLADAATFDSWEDFKAFYTDSLNRPKDSAVPEGADDAWYREAYSRAKQIEAQGTYDDEHATKGTPAEGSMADSGEKDRQFAEMIRQPGKLDEFLKAASRAYLSQDWQPVDYEDEQDMQESKRQRERVRSEMKHGTWVSSILAAHRDADKETVGITGRARKTLLSLITRNGTSIRDYRDLYADVMHDETWSVPEGERTERILAERIQSPDEDAFRVLTPEQRAAMADELDFEDLKKELRDGTMQMDMDTVQNLADGYEREIDMQKSKIKRIQAEDANTAEKLVKRNAELEKARYDLEAAQKKKGQLEGVRDIKLRLIKSTMRRVDFKNVDYEYGRKIIAIQKMFSPTLNKMVQKFIDVEGPYLREAYSRFKTDADYREKLQIIADNGSRKAREVVKLFSKPFDKWTDAEMNMAAKSLPRTDWVESLNLEQLEKDRNGSIQMDVQDEETQKLLKDTLPADIYALLSRKDLKLWTLEEMEGLTAVVSDLYKTGRDNLRAAKEAKLASAADYRIRIEKALKSSGIVVNPDDPDDVKKRKLEDIERFRNKELPKILGTGAPIKGTLEASERERSWLDRVVHGYGDRNIRRIARLLDNGREGVNTGLLYYREDECYNGEQRSVTARTNKILKAMEDNKVKMEDLFKKYQVKFSDGGVHTFTADELLFFESAARDRPDYAKMTDKEALNGDPTSFEAVACGNMYDDTVKQEYYAKGDKGQTEYLKKCTARMDECIAASRKLPDNLRALMTAIQDDYTDQYERMNRASIDEFNQPVWRVKDYVPLNRLESNGDTNMNLVKEDMLGTSQGTGSAGGYVGKGMTQKRIHIMPTAQRPVVTGLYSTWASSMQRTEHFIHYASYVRDLNRVYNGFNSRSTRQYMDNRYGRQMHAYIEDYIKELANPNPQNAKTDLDRVIRALRGRTAPAYLAWKTSGVVKQFCTSPWPYMQYVSPLKYAAACIDCVKDGKLYDAIKSKSAYMNSRVFDPMVDLVNEQKEKSANGAAHALSSFEAAGMKGLEWVDWACVAPGWLAVYRDEYAKLSSKEYQDSLVAQKKTSLKSFEDVNGPAWVEEEAEKARMSDEEIERLAVRKADDATRMCQPSSRSTDLSPMFKTRGAGSEAAQVLLQFTTSLNVIWQNIRYDMPDAVRNRQWRQVVGTVAGYTMAGIAMGLVTQGLPKDDGDDDDEKRRKDLLQTLYYGMTQYTDAVPVVGSMVSDVVQGVMTGKWNFGTSDMFPITTKTTSGIKDISKGDWEKACSDFGYALGLGMGLPVSGAKEAGAVLGVGDGDGKADFYPQALVGRRKNK